MEAWAWLALKARMDLFTECDVAYTDSKYKPVATKPYVFCQFVPLPFESGVIDPVCGEDFRGSFNISVFAPTTWNAGQHLGLAQRVANHFAWGEKYCSSDYCVTIYQRSKVTTQPYLDQAHNRVEVDVRWRIWG